jgi:ribonuclease D
MSTPSDRPDASPAPAAPPSKLGKHGGYSRSAHRARAHDAAHGEGVTETVHSADHPLIPRGNAPLLTTNGELTELMDHCRTLGSFAYDSEFIGELTYNPKLCVVQIATRERVALIDPLTDIDLKPFWELLTDPSVEKIVHAGEQDIEPVMRHIGRPCANVFDTQIAAGFAGLPYPLSLSKLVHEVTGAKLGKGLTFTHWDQRPLSPSQLKYAADDVRYLPRVREDLRHRLEKSGHADWAMAECDAQCDPSLYGFNPVTAYTRVRGAGSLQPRNLAILRELTIWRDACARHHDVPPRAFLKDEILIDLSRNPAKSIDRLDRVRGLPRPVEHQHGQEIVDLTLRAFTIPANELPEEARDPELPPPHRFHSDAMWAAAQTLCAGRQIDPAIVISRQDMSDFYRALIANGDMSNQKLMKGWRKEAIGEPLIELYRGKYAADLRWTGAGLVVNQRTAT